MPRKPREIAVLRIEGLSDGREVRAKSFVDDFTGETVAIPQDDSPARVIEPVQVAIDRENRAKLARKRELLERLGLMPSSKPKEPKLVAPHRPGYRSVPIKLAGETKALQLRNPAWRRI